MHWIYRPEKYNVDRAVCRVLRLFKNKSRIDYDGRFRKGTMSGLVQEIYVSTYKKYGIKLKRKDLVRCWYECCEEQYKDTYTKRILQELERQRDRIDKKIAELST